MSCNCGTCTETTKICSQTNIPQVDNTALECENGFISTKCIINHEAIPLLGLPENSDLKTILDALVASLIDARGRIKTLEN